MNAVLKVQATGLRLLLVIVVFGVAFGVASLLERLFRTYVPNRIHLGGEPLISRWGAAVPKRLRWPLFAACVVLALGVSVTAELQQARTYRQSQPAKVESSNEKSSETTSITNKNTTPISDILRQTEFWSAIAGAVVGGFIACLVQIIALRETRRQRDLDRKLTQQALGRALLIKLGQIISSCHGVYRHFDLCFERARQLGLTGEPWQFVLPSANTPAPVNFSMDELGMLLSLRNDEVFNALVGLDTVHNSLLDAFRLFNSQRQALTDRLPPGSAEHDNSLSGRMPVELYQALRPRMIEVNTLIDQLRAGAHTDLKEAIRVLDLLTPLLREKLDLHYKTRVDLKPTTSPN